MVQKEISILSFAGHFVQSWGKVCDIMNIVLVLLCFSYCPFQGSASFVDLSFVFDILSSLCLAVLRSADGKGMISCLSYV